MWRCAVALLVLGPGCGRLGYELGSEQGDGQARLDGQTRPDGSAWDGAGADSAPLDAGRVDASSLDGGMHGAPDAGVDGGLEAGTDAGVDAGPPTGIGPFTTIRPVTILNTELPETDPSATADMLELYFASDRAVANLDIYVSRRASTSDPWGAPAPVPELNSLDEDQSPEVAADGLTLYLASTRSGGMPQYDIYVSTRASRSSPWSTPTYVSALSSGEHDVASAPGADGLRIMLHRYNFPSYDIMEATRSAAGASFGAPVFVTSLNTEQDDGAPFLWNDALTVVFDSHRPGEGKWDLYVAVRPSLGAAFGGATPLSEINTADKEAGPWVSPDGGYILFTRGDDTTASGEDIWEAFR